MIPKFRAWDQVNKRMVSVWAIHWRAWRDSDINFVEVEYNDGTYELSSHDVKLMQSTGLYDTYADDKVEITDGDGTAIGTVVFNPGQGQWEWWATEHTPNCISVYVGQKLALWAVFDPQYRYHGKIIGNIHQIKKTK